MLLALVHLQMQQLLPDLAEELDKFSGKRFNSTCTDFIVELLEISYSIFVIIIMRSNFINRISPFLHFKYEQI